MPFVGRYLLKISPEIPLQSVLHSSSHQAEEINHVTNYFFITAEGILLIVILLTAYVLYKFRENKRQSSSNKVDGVDFAVKYYSSGFLPSPSKV
ncbi:MAG TPA: cytochrome c oxidase subunit II transmembrane domain-containing protein [Flavisolibacter sp.]|nr:cytochrome c oxidase subunit II transmembrane domain-containing protein [Flavisolibacter sp.]